MTQGCSWGLSWRGRPGRILVQEHPLPPRSAGFPEIPVPLQVQSQRASPTWLQDAAGRQGHEGAESGHPNTVQTDTGHEGAGLHHRSTARPSGSESLSLTCKPTSTGSRPSPGPQASKLRSQQHAGKEPKILRKRGRGGWGEARSGTTQSRRLPGGWGWVGGPPMSGSETRSHPRSRLVSERHLVACPGMAPPPPHWGAPQSLLPQGASTISLNTPVTPHLKSILSLPREKHLFGFTPKRNKAHCNFLLVLSAPGGRGRVLPRDLAPPLLRASQPPPFAEMLAQSPPEGRARPSPGLCSWDPEPRFPGLSS